MPTIDQCLKTLTAAVALALPAASHAATLCVNPGGTAGCFASIQEAIWAAAPSGDVIDVAAGTYTEIIRVDRSVDIRGAGRDVTIVDGGYPTFGNSAVFRYPVNFDPVVVNTISSLTVRNGYRGVDAGRFNTVNLQNVRLTGNGPGSGAGAFNNASMLIVRDSLVDNNRAIDGLSCDWYWDGGGGGGLGAGCGGGAIHVYGSTITNNYAFGLGSGLLMGGYDDVVENTTVSGNRGDEFGKPTNVGVAALMSGFGQVRFSTFADNQGGGFAVSDQMYAFGNVVQGNTSGVGNCWGGTIMSGGYNVSADGSCAFGAATDLNNTDAMLQPLADNGGALQTHALLPHSPAVDLIPGASCDLAADERGVARPQGANCDAGAYEWQDVNPPVIAAMADVNVPATRPSGADVSYPAPAASDDLGIASLGCAPASGSAFAVGDTTVTCTAVDLRGNSAQKAFKVHVRGVGEQIANLLGLLGSVNSGLNNKVGGILGAIAIGHPKLACTLLKALDQEVQALTPKKIPAAKSAEIRAAILQLKDALDC